MENKEENKICVKVRITGKVQGVFYRAHTRKAAIEYGVSGYVKNCPDGSVEAVFQGNQDTIDQMIQWCQTGSPSSIVSDVLVEKRSDLTDFHNFEITY
ncbi:MAG: acylphosphatase [Pseudomonadota bacterium]